MIRNPMALNMISLKHKLYHGKNIDCPNEIKGSVYLIGPSNDNGEYPIYRYESGKLIKIIKCSNTDDALKMLKMYNSIGYHHEIMFDIFTMINEYIDKDITCHEMIIGIISRFGYQADIRLQEVIQFALLLGANDSQVDISIQWRERLMQIKDHENYLFKFYSNLYDLVVISNHFRNPSSINMHMIITRICIVFLGNT